MPSSETDTGPLTATVHQMIGWRPLPMNPTPRKTGDHHPTERDARMSGEWYIDSGGRVEGPISEGELRDRAASGQLHPTDSVSTDRLTWVPASSVAGIAFPARQPLTETVVSGSASLSDSTASSGALSPLDSIPGFELEPGALPLGIGACGVVYKARQVKLDRVVALKTVLMAENTPPEVLARFEQEAVSLARLQHPNIVSVYDCGHSKGRAFFAMELLHGEDLAARLARGGPLDEPTAWLIARQTAAALAHAAKLGVIHRDIKPANLFLVPPPTGFPLPPDVPMVKVTDFGLALTQSTTEAADQRQTAAGVLLGTPVYMAPEQFTGSNVDPRADIYSLGATIYHALSGEPPFDGRSIWEVMMRKSAPPPRLAVPPVSPETAELVAAMMAIDPNDRPADYASLIARIDRLPCMEGTPGMSGLLSVSGRLSVSTMSLPDVSLTCPVPRPAPPQRRTRWIITGVVLALALVGAAAGIAALAGAFKQPAPQADPDAKGGGVSVAPGPSKGATYVPGDAGVALFDGKSVLGWRGRGVTVEKVEGEQNFALVIETDAARSLNAKSNFRVVLAVDCFNAKIVEVVLATSGRDSPDATQWLVRVDTTNGVALGKRVNGGAFDAVGPSVPFPKKKANQPPFLELRYEHVGDKLAAWFDTKPLGQTSDAGLKTTEFRIETTGGPVRIESAEFVELVEKKETKTK